MQEERLWIADPKAAHHIIQGSGNLYGRLNSVREMLAAIMGRGLAWADGEVPLKSPMV